METRKTECTECGRGHEIIANLVDAARAWDIAWPRADVYYCPTTDQLLADGKCISEADLEPEQED